MIPHAERVLDFSDERAFLRVRHGQLVIQREGKPDISTPIAEVAIMLLATSRVSCTQSVLAEIMESGGVVLVCDRSMMPIGMMVPLSAHHASTQRLRAQIDAGLPRKKRIWQQIVVAKILAQAGNLRNRTGDDHGLVAMAGRVRSGDPDNLESQAAQRYWPRLFGDLDFRRRRDAPDQNRLLNYGYAVLRAAVARAICASGLHPSIGVHHHGRSNPYCLADDLMEPWRAMIDSEVAEIAGEWGADVLLDATVKSRLIGVLHQRLDDADGSRTVLAWIARSASSLADSLCGDVRPDKIKLFFPQGLLE